MTVSPVGKRREIVRALARDNGYMVEPVLFLALFGITLAVALPNALRYAERIGQPGYVGLGLGLGATVLFWVCIVEGLRRISAGVRAVVRLTGFVVNRLRPRHPRP